MATELTVVESQPAVLTLSEEECRLLRSLGRELASASSWWGNNPVDQVERSVVAVENIGPALFRVTFRNVIGVVRLPGRQIEVTPKIPFNHFLYIASRSELAPRVAASTVAVEQDSGFIEVLARWCIDATEKLLRLGLRKDYATSCDELDTIRGRLQPCETALALVRGRPVAICEVDDLTEDAPLNRVVRGACERLARLDILSNVTRDRARRTAHRMGGVGPIQPADLRVSVDRVSKAYATVIPLALLVLSGLGLASSLGRHIGTAFLIRTPELVEDGLRTVLSETLSGWKISKRKLALGDSGLSMNPDLVIQDGFAVGDVKYRYLAADWNRSDLNQVVAFATGFRSSLALLLGFVREEAAAKPRSAQVGAVSVKSLAWDACADADPARSAARLCAQLDAVLAALQGAVTPQPAGTR